MRRSLAIRFAVFTVTLALAATALVADDTFALAITKDDLDLAACQTVDNGQAKKANPDKLCQALGVVEMTGKTDKWHRKWSAGRAGTKHILKKRRLRMDPETFHYRIAFQKPMAIGSILCTNQRIAVLKPDAPYPGDPANPEHWQSIPIPPHQGHVRIAALPVGTTTRAVLLSDTLKSARSVAWPVRFYEKRLHNITPDARARAQREYHAPTNFGDRSYTAGDLISGKGSWISNGKNRNGNIVGPFISDVEPCWFALAWDSPQEIVGLFHTDNFKRVEYQTFAGSNGTDPLIGTEKEWKNVRSRFLGKQTLNVRSDHGRWSRFTEPVETQGLRLRILGAWERRKPDSQVARMRNLLVLRDLGEEPVPEAKQAGPPKPPFKIPYTLAEDGMFTLAVNDGEGKRVRNLVARVQRKAGEQDERWDLKDEQGLFIEPGTYQWKAITNPGIEIRYEQTVYPNVSVHHPENPAWLTARNGPGGWLADHSPPFGGCAGGDYVFFTGPTPESGIGFAACDLSGKKLWGIPRFGAWTGGNRVASDGTTVYVESFGWHDSDAGADRVWAVDIATQEVTEILRAKSDERRARGCKGIATRDGKVYLAINAKEKWITNAAGLAAVDIDRCIPRYPPPRKPKRPYEVVPNPRNDFLRLFRLTGTPPGYAPDHGLTFLESTKGPGREQQILLTFHKPVCIGSCVFPLPPHERYRVKLAVLKPDAPYPPDPNDASQWEPFETHGEQAWAVARAKPATVTRAFLITFYKGEDDAASALLDEIDAHEDNGGVAWMGRLEGMKLLRRRFQNLYGSAKVRVTSGAVDKNGVWVAERDKPLSPSDPEIFLMEWNEPQSIRGLAIKEIDCKRTEVDVWTGPAGSGIPLKDGSHWKHVGTYVPRRRMDHGGFDGHNADARYMDGVVDFGEDVQTRAIRLRVVEQWTTETRAGSCAKGRLQLDPTRCRLFGVAPVQYLGGEQPVDPLMTERLEVLNPKTKEIEREIPITKPGDLDFNAKGELFAISEKQVVRVDFAGGEHQPVVTDLVKPTSIAIDGQGHLYVFDTASDRKVIRVYNANGALQRTIGTPGGYQVGPWNPMRFQNLSSMAVDKEDKLWVVDSTYWPKRVACFRTDGTHLRDTFGPTEYGSGGVLNPYNKRQLFYGPLEFELDWEKGTSRLKNLTWDPADGRAAGEMPFRVNSRLYLVTRPRGSYNTMACGIVYIYEKDRLRRVAALGAASAFGPLKRQEIIDALGGKILRNLQFVWSDRNGDGEVQFEEVKFDKRHIGPLTRFNDNLEVQARQYRFEVKRFLDNGAPIYEEKRIPLPFGTGHWEGQAYRLDNGTYTCRGNDFPDVGYAPDGTVLWTYPNEGAGVGPDRSCNPYTPDQVVCQFIMIGHETAAKGDLGEFFVYNANLGSWNIWTADGLLAGRIFRDLRDPKRIPWTMPEHQRGLDLSDATVGQEHFNGWVCRCREDGKYYAVAGHHQASVVELIGLDDFTRLEGPLTVTPEDLRAAQAWEKEMAKYKARASIKLIQCTPLEKPVRIDGNLEDWDGGGRASMGDAAKFRMGYDKSNLYLGYTVQRKGPFKNTGKQWDILFKTGACVDLMIATDETADPKRKAPVEGDKRLLLSRMKGEPIAVLYDAVVPGTPEDQMWRITSPVTTVVFDRVKRLPEVQMWVADTDRGYVVEAKVPLASIGLRIEPDKRIKLDWGFLETDKNGTVVLARTYWANKATSTLADAPSEARLQPDLWGYARFVGKGKDRMAPDNLLEGAGGGDEDGMELELEEP